MVAGKPHYLIYCGVVNSPVASHAGDGFETHRAAKWHFVLESLDSEERLEATDIESGANPDRLSLLALVRALEALEQPSRVTLLTGSRYVSRGLRFGLNEWQDNEYRWEHFGAWRPIRNADLWKRVSHALDFHDVNCRMTPDLATVAAGEEEMMEFSSPQAVSANVRGDRRASRKVADRCLESIRDIGQWLSGRRQGALELATT
jgi:ribonuclease HI